MDADESLHLEWKTKPEIERIRAELETERSWTYVQDLEKEAAERTLVVNEASQEDMGRMEREFEEEKFARLQEKVASRRDFQVELINRRQDARQRLLNDYAQKQKKYLLDEERTAYQEHVRHAVNTKHYHKAEHRLRRKLKAKDGDVSVEVRESAEQQSLYGAEVRAYKVTWKHRPQPIEIRLHQARVLKDKVPKGQYSVRCAVWDRLGGQPLAFSREDPSVWNKQSKKVEHGGEYHHLELLLDDSLEVLAPSKYDLRPTMVLLFELLHHGIRDEILATAVFPLCNSELDYAQGQFKAPFLRGILHKKIQKFSDFEGLYSQNVDDWLCNLYFELRKQAPLMEGQKDYTVLLTKEPEAMEQQESKGLEVIDYETLRTPDQFTGYQQSVMVDAVFSNPVARIKYIAAEIVAELGILAYRHKEFYITLFFLCLSIWVSRYTHYIGEYLFLKGERVAVSKFDVRLYTIEISYPAEMNLEVEIGVIILGVVFTLACFIFLGIVAFAASKLLGKYPEVAYQFTACFGLIAILDPVVTIVEVALRNKQDGDMYKLYNYFGREEGSPAVGAFLTGFMYLGLMGISLFFYYSYLLYVHMNSRLLDMYIRLTAPEAHFFLPSDSEVSMRYLDWVIFKARDYHGLNGDQRKVNISEYNVAGESYRHVCVYTIGVDHSRVLYRHFLLMGSGAICELAGARLG